MAPLRGISVYHVPSTSCAGENPDTDHSKNQRTRSVVRSLRQVANRGDLSGKAILNVTPLSIYQPCTFNRAILKEEPRRRG